MNIRYIFLGFVFLIVLAVSLLLLFNSIPFDILQSQISVAVQTSLIFFVTLLGIIVISLFLNKVRKRDISVGGSVKIF